MEIKRIYRHGDVILFKLRGDDYRGERGEATDVLILAEGEVTGHAHRLRGKLETLHYRPELDGLLFRVREQAVLTHEEHDRMVLEPGVYLKTDQVEFDPFDQAVRVVMD